MARLGADGRGWAVEVGGKDEDDVDSTVFEGGGAGSNQSVGLGALFEIFGFEPSTCSVVLNVASSKSTSDQLLTASEPAGNKSWGSGGCGRRNLDWRRIAEVFWLH